MLHKHQQKLIFTSLILKLAILLKDISVIGISVIGISVNSLANEAALYDLAPKDSAFLRVIDLRNEQRSPEKLIVRVKGKRLSTESYCSSSAFIYLPSGTYGDKINGLLWKGTLKPNQAYSLVVDNSSVRLIDDYLVADSRRALLAVHNYSYLSQVGLQTAKSAHPVFVNIPRGETSARVINPLKSAFVVVENRGAEAVKMVATQAIIFQPGVLSSLFICADQAGIFTRWADSMGAQ